MDFKGLISNFKLKKESSSINFYLDKNKVRKLNIFRKYNYDINRIIGVKEDKRYIIYQDKHLLRVYRDSLKSTALLTTYIPIEEAVFFSFQIERSMISKLDLDSFIETKVYAEAGIDETEKYIIKYKIIDSLKDDKYLMIETISVSYSVIETNFDYILEESEGYIDYISFPAFAYKTLYDEAILTRANDMFVVLMYDKIFLTFYSGGELLSILTITGGLNRIYDTLEKLNIKNFNKDVFVKLLLKKGLNRSNFYDNEIAILDILQNSFNSILYILSEQISKIISKYDVKAIDRVFITSEYGTINALDKFVKSSLNIESFAYEFYEKYNLDRLIVDPFLFLGMLEAHHAYKTNDQAYNFSFFYRRPTFFYRPSGRIILITTASLFIFGAYPLYLYINALNYKKSNEKLETKIKKLEFINKKINSKINKIKKQKQEVLKFNSIYLEAIKSYKSFITEIYNFKYNYIPKSKDLLDLTLLFNKYNIYIDKLNYKDNLYIIDIFSFNGVNISDLIDELIQKGYLIEISGIYLDKDRYISQIRINR